MIAGFLLSLGAFLQGTPSDAPPPVVVVELDGQLDATWAPRLLRAKREVQDRGAAAFFLQIDTPGGEVELMRRLGKILLEIGESAETVAFVNDRALSAGSYLAMACQRIYMTPMATMGAAAPIAAGPGGLPIQLDPTMEEKLVSYVGDEFRNMADLTGRNPDVAAAFVDPKIEIKKVYVAGEVRIVSGEEYSRLVDEGQTPETLEILSPSGRLLDMSFNEALKLEFCDGGADNLDELIEGLGFGGGAVLRVETNWSEDLVRFVGGISWLLLLGAAFFMVVAFNIPGLGAPEALAAVCVILFLFHHYLVGLAEWTDVLLVGAGLVLIFVEIFLTPGLIVAGALGGAFLLVGLMLSMQDFVIPSGGIEMGTFQDNLLLMLLIAVGLPIFVSAAVRRFTRTRAGAWLVQAPTTAFAGAAAAVAGASGEAFDAEARPGDRGVCLTALRPSGSVEVSGIPVDARSSGAYLEAGAEVRVLRVEGGTVIVGPLMEEG